MMQLKTVRLALWAAVAVAGAAVAGVWVGRLVADEPPALAGTVTGAALVRAGYAEAGGPFAMTDVDGNRVTDADFRGKPVAMFFGFLNCPDVCPTAMVDAASWLKALGPDADKLRIVFVTVDPERDAPAAMKAYLAAFDPRIVGLTPGTTAELAKVAAEYKVRYEKVDLGEGAYTMNHTSDTLLFDADGTYAGFIPYTQPTARQDAASAARAEDAAVAQLRRLVS